MFCDRDLVKKKGFGNCFGNKHAHHHHFDFVKSFFKAYEGVGRMSFNHILAGHEGTLSEIEIVDKHFPEFLKHMDQHFSNNTVTIIFGDHGPRYGEYRQTLVGKLEERLPALFVLVPPWLIQKYPYIAANLQQNQHLLTTAFDIHQTVRDIMLLEQPFLDLPIKNNTGVSLLRPIPRNRSCEDVNIQSHWCACMTWQELGDSDATVRDLSSLLLDHINTETGNGGLECAKLELDRVDNAQVQNLGDKVLTYKIGASKDAEWSSKTKLPEYNYRIQIKARPGDAVFEGVIFVSASNEKVVRQVSRLSKYSHQETCTNPDINPAWCVCKNWLAGETKAVKHLIADE